MYGYLHEFICDLRGLSRTIARTDPASLDWAVHKIERIYGILNKHGVRSEREDLGVEPIPAGPDQPECDETIPCYHFDHFSESADSTLKWSLHLHGFEKKPVEAEVRVDWRDKYVSGAADSWETLLGSRRRWTHQLPGRPDAAVPKRRAFEIVERMAAQMAALKTVSRLR